MIFELLLIHRTMGKRMPIAGEQTMCDSYIEWPRIVADATQCLTKPYP